MKLFDQRYENLELLIGSVEREGEHFSDQVRLQISRMRTQISEGIRALRTQEDAVKRLTGTYNAANKKRLDRELNKKD